MFKPRIIPVLLLKNQFLVKSVQFKSHAYIGDPINAVRLFNDLQADELVFLDISAQKRKTCISLDIVKHIGEEANMPFAVGGGIQTIEHIRSIINAGAEKVVIGTAAAKNPDFVNHASQEFGSSTITICIDVKKTLFGKEYVWISNGKTCTHINPEEYAVRMQEYGAGEIIIQSIVQDGTMKGYNIDLIQRISKAVHIPVVALGGAGTLHDLHTAYVSGYAHGLAAGSLFVYQGANKGVLINYPDASEKNTIFKND